MAEPIFSPSMAALLAPNSPQQQQAITLAALLRAGQLDPNAPAMPQTLTGAENIAPAIPQGSHPSLAQTLYGVGLGALTPFTPTPPPMRTTRMVPTLGGERELPIEQVTRFGSGDRVAEAVGGMVGGGPAFTAARRMAAPVGRAAMEAATSHPTLAGFLTAGGIAGATAAETQAPNAVEAAQRRLDQLMGQQTQLSKRQSDLTTDST